MSKFVHKNPFLIIFIFIVNIIFVLYLLIPVPTLPDLPYSAKSDEPGDTTQMVNITAFYTNQTRTQVINFYKAKYTSPIIIRLNHPPEKSKEIIRDTTQSYYLEEFIIPFKESIFVNGYEWENDVFTKPEARAKNKLIFKGKEYKAKITIKKFPTNIAQRLFTLLSVEIGIIYIIYFYRQFLKPKK